jgi:hypothetical protein
MSTADGAACSASNIVQRQTVRESHLRQFIRFPALTKQRDRRQLKLLDTSLKLFCSFLPIEALAAIFRDAIA